MPNESRPRREPTGSSRLRAKSELTPPSNRVDSVPPDSVNSAPVRLIGPSD